MDFAEVIRGRRSMRAYTPQLVPDELVREILEEARWAPSWANTQSWSVWVLTDGGLERFKAGFQAFVAEGKLEPGRPDILGQTDWPSACADRMACLMEERTAHSKAAGESPDVAEMLKALANVFGAPCLLIVGFDRRLSEAYGAFDSGMFVSSLCLAAESRGLGTCITHFLVRDAPLLHSMLPGSEEMALLIAVALGWPDLQATVNTYPRTRAALDEFVAWVR